MNEFLSEPRPERIQSVFFVDGQMKTRLMLTVGVKTRTEDNYGLAIPLTKEVVIAIGPEDNPEQAEFSIPASMARELARRIMDEYVAVCEAPVT